MDEDALRKLVNNERLKLLATFMNGIAIAVFAVGAIVFQSLRAAGNYQATAFDDQRLLRRIIHPTLSGEHSSQRITTMSSMQTISILITPIGGLLTGIACLFLARSIIREGRSR
jgi:hypothetical protein